MDGGWTKVVRRGKKRGGARLLGDGGRTNGGGAQTLARRDAGGGAAIQESSRGRHYSIQLDARSGMGSHGSEGGAWRTNNGYARGYRAVNGLDLSATTPDKENGKGKGVTNLNSNSLNLDKDQSDSNGPLSKGRPADNGHTFEVGSPSRIEQEIPQDPNGEGRTHTREENLIEHVMEELTEPMIKACDNNVEETKMGITGNKNERMGRLAPRALFMDVSNHVPPREHFFRNSTRD
ncbi:hypothetical protein Scep_007800 [Stephania cephalantha]|uniref:Uncharacterized protein n=1 Tax=Stephania cephalantha TaxID=152367 RepID=A0AAP0KCC5_9MAGN